MISFTVMPGLVRDNPGYDDRVNRLFEPKRKRAVRGFCWNSCRPWQREVGGFTAAPASELDASVGFWVMHAPSAGLADQIIVALFIIAGPGCCAVQSPLLWSMP
jgi:hypothetical protein